MKHIIVSLMAIIFFIVGVGYYLGPDDIRDCEVPMAGSCAPVDAIVVVSGGDTNARVAEAVRLYKRGWSNRLIFSGAAADATGLSNALAMKQYAIKLGVSVSAISIEEFSRTTAENARNTSDVLRQADTKRILLVTSAYHQRRAGLEFARQLPQVTILNHPVARDQQWSWLWWSTPIGWWLAVGELVKIALFYIGAEALL